MEALAGERIQDERSERDWDLKRGLKTKFECAQKVAKDVYSRRMIKCRVRILCRK